MSRSCPSCGSAVEPSADTCPVCGESLADSLPNSSLPENPGAAPVSVPAEVSLATSAPVVESQSRQICPECGAANPAGAAECSVCGEPLGDQATARHTRSRSSAARGRGAGSRTYLYAAIALLFLTGFVFLISRREEVTSAPTAEAAAGGADSANGGMPHNHPPVDQGPPKPSPEALAQVAALEKQLKEKPNDDSTKVHLADLYLDVGRYPEAVTLFRDVLGNRSNAELQMRLASAIAATGDNDGAIAEIARVAKAEPKNQRAGLAMAAMYVNKRDLDSLTIWLDRVYAIDSTSEAGQQAAMFLEKIKDLPRK